MDETEKQQTIATVTARLAARYPDAPRPLIAGVEFIAPTEDV